MVHYFRRSFVPILLDRVDFLLIVLSSMEFGLRYLCHTNRICSRINEVVLEEHSPKGSVYLGFLST